MYFLRDKDYNTLIRPGNLDQIASDIEARRTSELIAQSELTSYLSNRFNTTLIFKPFNVWDANQIYGYGDRVDFDAPIFNALATYTNAVLLSYNGKVYEKNTNTTSYIAGILPTNTTFFIERGNVGVYYVTTPIAYDLMGSYAYQNQVYYKGHYWIKNIITTGYIYGIDPEVTAYWGRVDTSLYNLAAGTWPNQTGWTFADNRNKQLVMYCVDITLYHCHASINPRNIPQLRIDRYNNAINWCKMVNAGDVTADLPDLLPIQGYTTVFGSNPKRPQYW